MSINIDFAGYLTEQIEARSVESGRRIRSTAQTIRTVAQELRNDPTTSVGADLAERGAEVVDRIGTYVEETPLTEMISDAERFGRQQPWVVASIGLGIGMLASRLVKSTAARRASMDFTTSAQ